MARRGLLTSLLGRSVISASTRALRPVWGGALIGSRLQLSPALSRHRSWHSSMSVAEMANKTGGVTMSRTVTMVKKLTADGSVCRKCLDIEARLERDGLAGEIDSVIYMDPEAAGQCEGTALALKHNVKVAPFFVVRTVSGVEVSEDVYPVYMKMKRELFGKKATVAEADTDAAMSIF
jgi:hypothetical protein